MNSSFEGLTGLEETYQRFWDEMNTAQMKHRLSGRDFDAEIRKLQKLKEQAIALGVYSRLPTVDKQ